MGIQFRFCCTPSLAPFDVARNASKIENSTSTWSSWKGVKNLYAIERPVQITVDALGKKIEWEVIVWNNNELENVEDKREHEQDVEVKWEENKNKEIHWRIK